MSMSELELKVWSLVFNDIEKDTKIDKGFVKKLLEAESDVMAIVSLAAMAEGILTKAIINEINHPKIEEKIKRMDQSLRIEWSKDLGITVDYQRGVFLALATIRNAYVHNIENYGKSLSNLLNELGDAKKKNLAVTFSKGMKYYENDKIDDKENQDFLKYFNDNCRGAIIASSIRVIARIYNNSAAHVIERDYENNRMKKFYSIAPKRIDAYISDIISFANYVSDVKDILKRHQVKLEDIPSSKNDD